MPWPPVRTTIRHRTRGFVVCGLGPLLLVSLLIWSLVFPLSLRPFSLLMHLHLLVQLVCPLFRAVPPVNLLQSPFLLVLLTGTGFMPRFDPVSPLTCLLLFYHRRQHSGLADYRRSINSSPSYVIGLLFPAPVCTSPFEVYLCSPPVLLIFALLIPTQSFDLTYTVLLRPSLFPQLVSQLFSLILPLTFPRFYEFFLSTSIWSATATHPVPNLSD